MHVKEKESPRKSNEEILDREDVPVQVDEGGGK